MVNNVVQYLPRDIFDAYFFPVFNKDLQTLSSISSTCKAWNLFVTKYLEEFLSKPPYTQIHCDENSFKRYAICISNRVTPLCFALGSNDDGHSFYDAFYQQYWHLELQGWYERTNFQKIRIEALQKFCGDNQIENINSLFQNGVVAFFDVCDQSRQWIDTKTNIKYFPIDFVNELIKKKSFKEDDKLGKNELIKKECFIEFKIQGESVRFYIYHQLPVAKGAWFEFANRRDKSAICPDQCFVPGVDESITVIPSLESLLPQYSNAFTAANTNRRGNTTDEIVSPQAIAPKAKSSGSKKKRKGVFTGALSSRFKRSDKSSSNSKDKISNDSKAKKPKKKQREEKRSPETKPKDSDKKK